VAAGSPEERRRVALAVAPALRGLLGRDRRVVMAFDDAPDVLEFACSKEAAALSTILLVASGLAVYIVFWVSGKNESAFV
jgi:rhamnose utilization protein RhaD (predicted bifunctional aldolase and dehydrogenase)